MIERITIRPPADEAEAAKIEADLGYIVCQVSPGKLPNISFQPYAGFDRRDAEAMAEARARNNPGQEYGVFVCVRTIIAPVKGKTA